MRTTVCIAVILGLAVAVFAGDACNNDADKFVFQKEWTTMHGKLDVCATKCLGNKACATACVKKDLALTDGCSACFGEDIACTAGKCMAQCIKSHSSPECLECHRVKCFPALIACAGVDESIIPK